MGSFGRNDYNDWEAARLVVTEEQRCDAEEKGGRRTEMILGVLSRDNCNPRNPGHFHLPPPCTHSQASSYSNQSWPPPPPPPRWIALKPVNTKTRGQYGSEREKRGGVDVKGHKVTT